MLQELPAQDSVSRNPYLNKDRFSFSILQDSAQGSFTKHHNVPYGQKAMIYMMGHPYYNMKSSPQPYRQLERIVPGQEWIFYLFCSLLLLLAFLRLVFDKYFVDLFRVFLNSSLRQKQIRDQLLQAPLPALFLNIFFVLSGGVFLYFILQHYGLGSGYNKWILMGLTMLGLSFLYTGKYFVLKLSGWIFDRRLAADIYIFIVFLVNKIMGLFLLPVSLFIAFAAPPSRGLMIKVALGGIIALLIYRLIRSYSALRNELKISQLHFVLYMCAFEILPVLLIYRVLMRIF
ncbi:MAG: DUF4271 domain-containing protein [Chitinophagaceae bacterium]|nr:DUF4271 domain-containing protein [Chitinophagaceae bacterium]